MPKQARRVIAAADAGIVTRIFAAGQAMSDRIVERQPTIQMPLGLVVTTQVELCGPQAMMRLHQHVLIAFGTGELKTVQASLVGSEHISSERVVGGFAA